MLHMPLWLQAVTGDTAISYSATDDRGVISALGPNPGTILAGDLLVGPRAAGANLSVDVAAGRAIVKGTAVANQGTYIVFSDAVLNVPLSTPDATNPRIDLIVYKVYDKQSDGGSQYGSNILPIAGVPAGSPAVPAVPADALVLAQVYVPANATSIVASGTNAAGGTGSITDKRVLSGVGDVPKWDMSGTTGTPQSVPSGTNTNYAPGTTFQLVGMGTSGMHTGEVQCLTPGRYVVHFAVRFPALGSNASYGRTAILDLFGSDGTTLKRRISQDLVSAGTGCTTAAGTMYMSAGDRLAALINQSSGGAVSVDNGQMELDFTGVWVGP